MSHSLAGVQPEYFHCLHRGGLPGELPPVQVPLGPSGMPEQAGSSVSAIWSFDEHSTPQDAGQTAVRNFGNVASDNV